MDPLVKVNVGSGPNDRTGDPLRDAFIKVNKNADTVAAAIGAPSGIGALGTDGRLVPAQIPNAQLLPITAHDLNTYTASGPFYQGAAGSATLANNYPVAGVTGFLEVLTFGTATLQQFSTRIAPYQTFWRIKTGTTIWSAWKETVDTTTAFAFQGAMPASPAQDLNAYTQRGQWQVGSSAIAAAGSNFPVAQSGQLLVFSSGYPGGQTATGLSQMYVAANSNRLFLRSLVTGVWSGWAEILLSALMGAAGGVATLDANKRLLQQGAIAENLLAGTDANSVVLPGSYCIQSDANATAALNWPILLAGTMTVEASNIGNMQVTQTYSTRTGRTFKRIRFLSSNVWEAWQEQAKLSDLVALGIGQSWQSVGASRAPNTNFTNSTGKPILVMASVSLTGANGRIIMYVDDRLAQDSFNPTSAASLGAQVVVPAGSTYRVVPVASAISGWWEYR